MSDTISILTICLIVYAVISVVISITLVLYDWSNDGVTTEILPQELYYNTDMNWVGCIIVSILLLALIPLVWLYRLFYMLFHIGRD